MAFNGGSPRHEVLSDFGPNSELERNKPESHQRSVWRVSPCSLPTKRKGSKKSRLLLVNSELSFCAVKSSVSSVRTFFSKAKLSCTRGASSFGVKSALSGANQAP